MTQLDLGNDPFWNAQHAERAPDLERMLNELKRADRLFEYNVPAALRQTLSPDELYAHIDRTYRQKSFTITNPLDIEKFAIPSDRVVKCGDTFGGFNTNCGLYVVADQKETKEGKAIVNISGVNVPVNASQLRVLSDRKGVFSDEWKQFITPLMLDEWLRDATHPALPPECLVEYVPKDAADVLQDPRFFIPNGAQGIILFSRTSYEGKKKYGIAWAWHPNLRQDQNHYDSSLSVERSFTSDSFALVVPNTVGYETIKQGNTQ